MGDIIVLTLSQGIPGRCCMKLPAVLGARVKIEPPSLATGHDPGCPGPC